MEDLPTLRRGPKKSHRKVRTGCTTCKRRKVKCDEERPICNQCVKQKADCDINSKSTSNFRQYELLDGPTLAPSQAPDLNMLDLELIYHWTLWTHDSLTLSPLLRTFWLRNTTKAGFRCDYVMRSILALSAVHLGHVNPVRSETLVRYALTQHNLAAATVRELIHHNDDSKSTETAENLFLYSVLINFYVISQTDDPHASFFGRTGKTENDTPDWMAFFKGSRNLSLVSSLLVSRSLTHPLIEHMVQMYSYRDLVAHGPYLNSLLQHMNTVKDGCFKPEISTYLHAAQELEATFGVLREYPETREIIHAFLLISNVSDHRGDFIALLQQPEPSQEALVIFTYFCMIPRRLPSRWWSEKWVKGLGDGAFSLLDDEHKAWIVEPPPWDS
ncbi:Sterol uptake control protein 2 [Colletotrichum siamense]|uniref:Sterol uptake control protein 2 n=1 Tax=Colletotrichum siamense TaxID=690259 RepID=A0A9P5KAL3_COLSI|nr:Sterol uptake control protein 2 [Colletotrichum siamense]KAF4866299.1 Sterol uptake control protein 2 [Colletotrichum siamense]